jgi:D-glycero-D-manno-heptose 1,7-bisphosphate phosphatase
MTHWIVGCGPEPCPAEQEESSAGAGRSPALFLDRDGVINVNHGYVHKIEDVDFVDGIFDLCRQAARLGYRLIVVTNQAGIGRGYYDEAAFISLTEWMAKQFRHQDAPLTAVYFCPHHHEHGIGKYRRHCFFRKPDPGMIRRAAEDHSLDLHRSVLIGDKLSDMTAAERAGVRHRILLSAEHCTVPSLVRKNTLEEISHWLAAMEKDLA